MIWLFACAPKVELLHQPWAADAEPAGDEILVLPVLDRSGARAVDYRESLGVRVPYTREEVRRERTAELGLIAAAYGWALPGEVGAALGASWDGRFLVGRWPAGARSRIDQALDGGDIDVALAGLADPRRTVLVTWVDRVDGRPISAEAMPGEVVHTAVGPVICDLFAEPYRVNATIGAALIAPDGQILVRVTDDVEAVLSEADGPDRVGRTLAAALAEDVAKLWPTVPRGSDGDMDDWIAAAP